MLNTREAICPRIFRSGSSERRWFNDNTHRARASTEDERYRSTITGRRAGGARNRIVSSVPQNGASYLIKKAHEFRRMRLNFPLIEKTDHIGVERVHRYRKTIRPSGVQPISHVGIRKG